MRNARLDDTQARIKIAGRNINNLRYADDTTLMAESEEELKSLLMRMKGFLGGLAGKESACNAGDLGSIYPWVGKIPWRRERLLTAVFWPGEFRGLYSPCIVHGIAKSWTRLSD